MIPTPKIYLPYTSVWCLYIVCNALICDCKAFSPSRPAVHSASARSRAHLRSEQFPLARSPINVAGRPSSLSFIISNDNSLLYVRSASAAFRANTNSSAGPFASLLADSCISEAMLCNSIAFTSKNNFRISLFAY